MRTTALVLIVMAAVAGAGPLCSQEPPAAEPTLQEEIARLNLTMRDIVALLEKQVDGQETSLLIKRIELSSQTLSSKQEALRDARADVMRLGEEETLMARRIELVGEALDSRETAGDEVNPYELMQLEQMEAELKSVERRRQDLSREIMELENDVASGEEDMRILKAVLDDRLGLR